MSRHHRERRRKVTGTPQDTIIVSDNRALTHALADEYRNIRRLGYQVNRINVRVSDIPDNLPRKDTRKLSLQNRRINTPLNFIRRKDESKLNILDKLRYANLRDKTYDLPADHPICQKRQERKEVLFATNKAGKGGQKPMKLPVLTIRCKK